MGTMVDNTQGTDTPPHGYKYMPCRYCAEPMLVGIKKRNAPGHVQCGVLVAAANMRQIAEKKGPYYDRWLAGQANYLSRLTGGGAPPSKEG